MRIVRQVLRLFNTTDNSQREIAEMLSISRQTVANYINRAKMAGLSWPLPESMDDGELEIRLFPTRQSIKKTKHPEPDWDFIQAELQKKGATIQVLHAEYIENNPSGMGYSSFCAKYAKYEKSKKVWMKQSYPIGEYVFVDYSGKKLKIIDKETGNEKEAEVFVAVLGYSKLIYVEVHWNQSLPNWIAATIRMLKFFGGSPKIIVCDNLKAAVTKANKNNPIVNVTYLEMADHYGIEIIPARPYKPKDKSHAENGVLHIQRRILFILRNAKFYELGEANNKIQELVEAINKKPFAKMEGSRWQKFIDFEKDILLPLPINDYQFAEYRKAKVGMDYHILFDKSNYSVPYTLAGSIVELRVTAQTIEILYKGKRVASHIRSYSEITITVPSHMSPNHKALKEFNIKIELAKFDEKGVYIQEFIKAALLKIRNNKLSYRVIGAINALVKEYGTDELNNACEYALKSSITTITGLMDILKYNLHNQSAQPNLKDGKDFEASHANIRGANYYH